MLARSNDSTTKKLRARFQHPYRHNERTSEEWNEFGEALERAQQAMRYRRNAAQ